MNEDTCRLFERVVQKMGWAGEKGLDNAEKKVCCTHGQIKLLGDQFTNIWLYLNVKVHQLFDKLTARN